MPTVVTPKMARAMAAQYRRGAGLQELAEEYGMSRSTIRYHIQDRVSIRGRGAPKIKTVKPSTVARLRRRCTVREIAAQFGVSKTTVYNRLKEAGAI